MIGGFGAASGLISILVLNLYLDERNRRASSIGRLAILMARLSDSRLRRLGRLWILANRGLIDDDPLKFVLRDPGQLCPRP